MRNLSQKIFVSWLTVIFLLPAISFGAYTGGDGLLFYFFGFNQKPTLYTDPVNCPPCIALEKKLTAEFGEGWKQYINIIKVDLNNLPANVSGVPYSPQAEAAGKDLGQFLSDYIKERKKGRTPLPVRPQITPPTQLQPPTPKPQTKPSISLADLVKKMAKYFDGKRRVYVIGNITCRGPVRVKDPKTGRVYDEFKCSGAGLPGERSLPFEGINWLVEEANKNPKVEFIYDPVTNVFKVKLQPPVPGQPDGAKKTLDDLRQMNAREKRKFLESLSTEELRELHQLLILSKQSL